MAKFKLIGLFILIQTEKTLTATLILFSLFCAFAILGGITGIAAMETIFFIEENTEIDFGMGFNPKLENFALAGIGGLFSLSILLLILGSINESWEKALREEEKRQDNLVSVDFGDFQLTREKTKYDR